MTKQTKPKKEKLDELAFFRNDKGKIQYNEKCKHCTSDCKQSFRAEVMYCKHYTDRDKPQ